MEEEFKKLRQELDKLEKRVTVLSYENMRQSHELHFLYELKELRMGAGNIGMYADRQGIWWGKKLLADVKTTPPAGTHIDMNGEIYPKGGVSGSFTDTADGSGGTLTITRGIITNIA